MAFFTNLYCYNCGETWYGPTSHSTRTILCEKCETAKNNAAWEEYRRKTYSGKSLEERVELIERKLYDLSKSTKSLDNRLSIFEPIG